ncbi:hypothetical protein GCK72_007354 [Caenorhabditis remanei]|uniref:Uncharacterized protein n=1 Tax=Caenorhabditis remanei TaxID=31234 RepID=A0A6A5HIU6_CAERE|nr:hypothetical protein GCK72_007354 [Caenorhabditis remanei]KAF1767395.1 hypothetical protein GCK72_007354 [Caenorhabditis remanei]
MKTQPLRYQSLKVVLLYMEENVRIKISQRLPTIRLIENLVPLRIRYLSLSSTDTSINDTKYFVGVYRVFQSDQIIPKTVESQNKNGGVQYDLDNFGFQAPPNYILEAGDVALIDLNGELLRLDTDEVEERQSQRLRDYETALALKNNSMDTEAAVEELPENNDQDIANNARIRRLSNYSVESLNESIASQRHALLPFHYRRHNLTPPYTCYIQLTVTTKRTEKHIQRYKYTKSIYEAAKQLNTILFGGRQGAIQVRDFTMPWCSILRVPVGFKIRVKCIEKIVEMSLRYNPILSIIDSSSFPLDKVTISPIFEADLGVNDFHLPAIRSAKLLKIEDGSFAPGLLPLLRTVPNQTVILIYSLVSFQADDYFALARSWLNDKRPVGTCYLFPIQEDEPVQDLLKLIRTRMENTKRTKRCVTVSMGHSNRLEVYYVPAKTHKNPDVWRFVHKWILTMRVVRVR